MDYGSAEYYRSNILPNIKSYDRKWLNDIFEHKREKEWILFEDDNVLLVPDQKFIKTNDVKQLHYLIFFKDEKLMSVRDVNDKNIQFINTYMKKCCEIIKNKYDVKSDPMCYFHYFPSVWQLHMHIKFNYVKGKRDILYERVHNNINEDGDYYMKASISQD